MLISCSQSCSTLLLHPSTSRVISQISFITLEDEQNISAQFLRQRWEISVPWGFQCKEYAKFCLLRYCLRILVADEEILTAVPFECNGRKVNGINADECRVQNIGALSTWFASRRIRNISAVDAVRNTWTGAYVSNATFIRINAVNFPTIKFKRYCSQNSFIINTDS